VARPAAAKSCWRGISIGAATAPGCLSSVNCGAISPTYADAELFGYAAGAHSGAASSRAGWFGSANGGTLYLDEIGDLPLPIQVKLLAALENHEVTRVGAQQPSPVTCAWWRRPASTWPRPWPQASSMSACSITSAKANWTCRPCASGSATSCPWPNTFLASTASGLGLPVPLISDAAQRVLEHHSWPGNTRELENVIHFALLVSSGDDILPEHLNLPTAGSPLEQVQRIFESANAAERETLRKFLHEQNGI